MLKKSSFIIHRNVSNNWIRSPGKVRQRLQFKPKNVQTRNNFSKYFKHNTAAAGVEEGYEGGGKHTRRQRGRLDTEVAPRPWHACIPLCYKYVLIPGNSALDDGA